MNRVAGRSAIVILLALLLVAGFGFFIAEYVTQADQWAVFSGSPHIYNGVNIGTGAVTDRDGVLLLDMQKQRTYSSSPEIRRSTVHWIGDRYGSIRAAAVPNYSKNLVGFDLFNGLYSFGGTGGVAELTLSAKLQTVALEALGDRKGTVAVYNYKTGEILCAVTTPTYDPDDVPDIDGDITGKYEGVYMNRFTQSSYTPGSIFKIVTLAAAVESLDNWQALSFNCTGTRPYGVDQIVCENVHGEQDLKQAFRNSCNCAFAELSELLGSQTLRSYVDQFGLTDALEFDGITTVTGRFEAAAEPVNVAWSAIGQYTDLVNPCAFMTFMGAVANGGKGAMPYVVAKAGDGLSGYKAKTAWTKKLLSQETAAILQEYMRYNVQDYYGDDNFPGLAVCAKTGTAEMDGDKASTAMLAGFVQDEAYPWAFMVCVEEGGYGRSTCVPIASKVLTACKELMNN